MSDRLKHLIGMAWATPVIRTAVQAAAGAGLAVLVAAGAGVFSTGVLKTAVGAATAALLAKLQESLRA